MKFYDFLNEAKKLEKQSQSGFPSNKKIKIALLSSFTTHGLKEVLLVKCHDSNIIPEIYTSDYNQYVQELLNAESALYRFNPDVIFLFIDIKSLMGELFFLPYSISNEQRTDWVAEKLDELKKLVQSAKNRSRAHIIIHNFEVPAYSPLGILEGKQSLGFLESIQHLNSELRSAYKTDPRVFVFDYESYCSHIGKRDLVDEKMYFIGDIKFRWEHMPSLCDAYLAYIKPLKSIIKKCIVLDLDNTLWGGVVGEDGFNGIRLGPTPEGRPFWEFQKHLLALSQRGILLAVNSKNNPEDALKVIREHPYMVLRENNFSLLRINWNDKVSNMKAISEELHVGLDSLVFMDDDKANCEWVRSALPEVSVVSLPDDPALYSNTLTALNDLNALQLTAEDLDRTGYYVSQKDREDFKKNSDMVDYLKKLQTVVKIEAAQPLSIPRISQLTQKTNQFNMTTKRYSEADIKYLLEKESFLIWALAVKDKFGDMGLVGVAIIEKQPKVWRIDSFLLSCRVIGRKVEEAFLSFILNEAKRNAVERLEGEFIPTSKNSAAKDFYKNNGFQITSSGAGKEIYLYDTARAYLSPDCITVQTAHAS